MLRGVLVTDFDGTITHNDFYDIVTTTLLPSGGQSPFRDYQAGAITHFEALRRIFAGLRVSEADLLAALVRADPEPRLAHWVGLLRAAGWEVVVTSAGCEWYIRRVLADAGVELEVHANLGRFEPFGGLFMELPTASKYFSPTHGIDKAAAVREMLAKGVPVAYAGDGHSDVAASLLVPPELRFARSDLAQVLDHRGIDYQSFDRWGDVARAVLNHGERNFARANPGE